MYLSTLYSISYYHPPADEIPTKRLVPPDLLEVIRRHPYTASYGKRNQSFNYLAENIDSLARLRSYTDLLEKMDEYLLTYVKHMKPASSVGYQSVVENWDDQHRLYEPRVRVCSQECLGMPKGTRLFEVKVPVFELQLAEINGKLHVVSARTYF